MKKGFVSPIGDDIPSIVIIVMSLTLFFSGIVFTLHMYNEKVDNINYLTGAIDISRVIVGYGGVAELSTIAHNADFIASSYGMTYDMTFDRNEYVPDPPYGRCNQKKDVAAFDFLVAYGTGGLGTELRILTIRVCKLT